MAKKPKPTQEQTIQAITDIRARNNVLWMGLLQLAMETSPKRAQVLLDQINANDKLISKHLGAL